MSWPIIQQLNLHRDRLDADIRADWVTVKAAWEGVAPYSDLEDLALRWDLQYRSNLPEQARAAGQAAVHPRLPGALLLLSPILIIPTSVLFELWFAFNLLLLLVLLWGCSRGGGEARARLLLLAPIALFTTPVQWTLAWSTQSLLVAVLVLYCWRLSGRWSGTLTGVPLGIAGTLKVFPLVAIVPLVRSHRERVAGGALGAMVLLSAVGAAVLGVSVREALGAIASAGSTWLPLEGNASLASLFHRTGMSSTLASLTGGGLGLVAVAWLLRRKLPEEETYFGSILAGLLASPLSWIHYDVVLIPLAARLWDRRHLSG
ncbi:MAG: glycosyltransferase family 87 protein, partial [Acidimicrobiia bacterium]